MKLWEIVFFTKDDAQADLDDITFIVRAVDPAAAASFVEKEWTDKPSYIMPFAVCAIEFGVDPFSTTPKILSGPTKGETLEFYYKEEDDYIYWRRDEIDEPWTNVNELHKGNYVTFSADKS